MISTNQRRKLIHIIRAVWTVLQERYKQIGTIIKSKMYLFSISEELTDANTLELLYQLVSRATSMVSQYTRRVKDEQNFRQTLWKTMKTAKKEQAEIVSHNL